MLCRGWRVVGDTANIRSNAVIIINYALFAHCVTLNPEDWENATLVNESLACSYTCFYVNCIETCVILAISKPFLVWKFTPRTPVVDTFSAVKVTYPVHSFGVTLCKTCSLTLILWAISRSCFLNYLSCCEVELTKCGTCKITIDVLHLTLVVYRTVSTAACHCESTSFRVYCKSNEVVIVQSGSNRSQLQRGQVNLTNAVACIRWRGITILVNEEVRIRGNLLGQRLLCEIEQSVSFLVQWINTYTTVLQTCRLRHCQVVKQFPCLCFPAAHVKQHVVCCWLLVAWHYRIDISVNISATGICIHHFEVISPLCLFRVCKYFFLDHRWIAHKSRKVCTIPLCFIDTLRN